VVALSSEHGFALFLAVGTILQGWALTENGEERITLIHQGLTTYQATGAELGHPWVLALLAEVYGQEGRPEEGLHMLTEALALADKSEERCYEGELYRLKGQLLWQQAESRMRKTNIDSTVESYFRQALGIARRQQAMSLELRAAMSLSRLWRRQGKNKEAHDLLAPIYGWFTEGFDTADLQEARALLETLGG
jgi:predicted ATPase